LVDVGSSHQLICHHGTDISRSSSRTAQPFGGRNRC
jgi:hypothetical protein